MEDTLDIGEINRDIDSVQLDSLVLLKIAQQCRDDGSLATGQLVGLQMDGVLEISNSFPTTSESANLDYSINMLRCLREVNIDHEAVGWYMSVNMGSMFTPTLIETQFSYQQDISQSVVLLYDPLRSSLGNIWIKAYRLSDAFMDLYKDKKFVTESLVQRGLNYTDILVEVPIAISKSFYATTLFNSLEAEIQTKFSPNISQGLYLEKTLELMTESAEFQLQEQYKWNRYQQQLSRQQQLIQHHIHKRKVENQKRVANGEEPLPEDDVVSLFKSITEPSRFENLISQAQMAQYCDQILGGALLQ